MFWRILRNNMQIQTTGTQIGTLFGYSGGWAQGMIARHLHSANSENPTARGCPKAIHSDKEKKLM
jgi:F0F1-type ATP synthase membrane subunit c/vacuolar-type H+-ATPase subunit K